MTRKGNKKKSSLSPKSPPASPKSLQSSPGLLPASSESIRHISYQTNPKSTKGESSLRTFSGMERGQLPSQVVSDEQQNTQAKRNTTKAAAALLTTVAAVGAATYYATRSKVNVEPGEVDPSSSSEVNNVVTDLVTPPLTQLMRSFFSFLTAMLPAKLFEQMAKRQMIEAKDSPPTPPILSFIPDNNPGNFGYQLITANGDISGSAVFLKIFNRSTGEFIKETMINQFELNNQIASSCTIYNSKGKKYVIAGYSSNGGDGHGLAAAMRIFKINPNNGLPESVNVLANNHPYEEIMLNVAYGRNVRGNPDIYGNQNNPIIEVLGDEIHVNWYTSNQDSTHSVTLRINDDGNFVALGDFTNSPSASLGASISPLPLAAAIPSSTSESLSQSQTANPSTSSQPTNSLSNSQSESTTPTITLSAIASKTPTAAASISSSTSESLSQSQTANPSTSSQPTNSLSNSQSETKPASKTPSRTATPSESIIRESETPSRTSTPSKSTSNSQEQEFSPSSTSQDKPDNKPGILWTALIATGAAVSTVLTAVGIGKKYYDYNKRRESSQSRRDAPDDGEVGVVMNPMSTLSANRTQENLATLEGKVEEKRKAEEGDNYEGDGQGGQSTSQINQTPSPSSTTPVIQDDMTATAVPIIQPDEEVESTGSYSPRNSEEEDQVPSDISSDISLSTRVHDSARDSVDSAILGASVAETIRRHGTDLNSNTTFDTTNITNTSVSSLNSANFNPTNDPGEFSNFRLEDGNNQSTQSSSDKTSEIITTKKKNTIESSLSPSLDPVPEGQFRVPASPRPTKTLVVKDDNTKPSSSTSPHRNKSDEEEHSTLRRRSSSTSPQLKHAGNNNGNEI